ncbi:MAG: flagellar biosynthesis protein FlhB [Pirellulaceae bacterium]
MPEQFGEKQYEATPYRKQKAREQGQVAKSQDLTSAILLISGVSALLALGDRIVQFIGAYARRQLGQEVWLSVDRDFVVGEWYSVTQQMAAVMLPIFGILLVVSVAANLGQVGFLFLPEKLALDLSRVNPLKGLQRLFSLSNVMRLAFGIFKLVVVGSVAYWCLWSERREILGLSTLEPSQIAPFLIQLALWTTLKIGVALLILAILDYAYQRWKQEQDLRMTTQEMREELKTLQGDPHIAARRRAIQRQLALNRIGTAVPKADVVITNPTELAIAIQYDLETMDAPVVVAKGAGSVAQRIRRIALEHDVPVVERKELARALYKQVEIGRPIPAEQYAAMAEVLRYVYQLEGRTVPELERAA